MPFIPPVTIMRSVSGLTAKARPISNISSAATLTKVQREDKGGSVKEQLASNLKQLGEKSQPRSLLPTAKAASGSELDAKGRERLLPLSQTGSFPASSSGESLSKTQQLKHASLGFVQREAEVKARARHPEEVRFTLTLTPEAVLLLQRRNIDERRRQSAPRNDGSGGGVCGSAVDPGRRRENVSKRLQPAAKNSRDAEPGDISSIVKISLLNEQHKYDDVEYEEEDHGVDERVVLKCTEWLRGLESTPVTVGHGLNKSVSGVKCF